MATIPDLGEKMDTLLQAFTNVREQLKEMQLAMKEMTDGMNELKVQSKDQEIRILRLEADRKKQEQRINNLEDRQRRSNLRLRGFKQDFGENKKLIQLIYQWFLESKITVDLDEIERVHWVYGPRNLANQKDIVIRFALERRAVEVFTQLKQTANLHYKGSPVRVLKDLSPQTLMLRNQMRQVTNMLQQNNQRYTWKFPATILIFKDAKTYSASSLEEGMQMLRQLGINPDINHQAMSTKDTIRAEGGEAIPLLSTGDPSSQEKEERIIALEKELALLREKGKKEEGRVTRQKKK